MTPQAHLRLLVYSFLTWLTFFLIGLPDYYQSWPFWAKLMLCIVVTGMYFPITSYSLKRFWKDQNHSRNALWLALYLTVPLFVYDYLLLGWHWDLGIRFVLPFWYLTFFYFSFWVQFPLVAGWLNKTTGQGSITTPPSSS